MTFQISGIHERFQLIENRTQAELCCFGQRQHGEGSCVYV